MNLSLEIFLIIIIVTSCASKTSFQVSTEPVGAKVFIKNVGSAEKVEVGKTPLKINSEELAQKKIKPGPIVVEFEKENYHTTNLYITDAIGVDVETNLPLKKLDQGQFAKDFDSVTSKVTEVQRYIKQKNYDKALGVISKMRKDFPSLSTPDEMEGSIYFLMKDFQKAHGSFLSAYTKNIDNSYALQMVKILEKNKGIVGNKKKNN